MLISPPFLPLQAASESDEVYVARCMAGDRPGDGAFPVSLQLGWHGGLHLTAPQGASGVERVRAIADGKVIYRRERTVVSSQPPTDHPLYYDQGYTSDGCVVIQHDTEIGATAAGQVTPLRFYSIYLHLNTIDAGVRLNQAIYRKDIIGQAGNIAGQPDRIHFEIVGDDVCVRAMLGRELGVALGAQGRTDAVFGDIHFRVPAGAVVYKDNPQTTTRNYAVHAGDTATTIAATVHASVNDLKRLNGQAKKTDAEFATFLSHKATANGAARNLKVPAPFAKPVAGLESIVRKGAIKQEIIVTLSYHGGDSTFTATLPDGAPLSTVAPVAVNVPGEEYDLYKNATARYPRCAAAGYEVLRFGRVIGPDALHADDVNLQVDRHVHFRDVPCLLADGTVVSGFVDLKAAEVQVYSDADLPPWRKWGQVQDVADGDSRCSAPEILRLLDADGDGKVVAAEASSKLNDPQVRSALARLLVKAPSEWEKASIDKRWGWLKQDNPQDYTPYLSDPMTPDSFTHLKAFVELLSFWEQVQATSGLAAGHWHFEPREFILHFRKCGWLTANEMAQSFPRSLKFLAGTQFRASVTRWSEASSRSASWVLAFNRAARRYGISQTKQRLGNLFAHVVPETGNLSLVKEIGGERARYAPYYGRGLIQLTFMDTYQSYGKFRNFSSPIVPPAYAALGWDPDTLLARDNHHFNADNCADSACFYAVEHGQMFQHLDHGMEQADGIAISKDVNGNFSNEKINGLEGRLQATLFMKRYFTDDTGLRDAETMTFTWRRNSAKEAVLDAQGHPVMEGHPPHPKMAFIAVQHVLPISLERQRP